MPGGGGLAALVVAPDVEVHRRTTTFGEILAGHPSPHPVGVADVVELAELAVELPQPGVVTHPVSAEVDQPRLAHAPVVVAGRVARPMRPLGIPVHPLLDVGDVQVVGFEEAGHPLALVVGETEGLDPVESHPHPGVPHHHVRDAQGALDQWRDLVAFFHVLPVAHLRSAASRPLPGERLVDGGDLVVAIGRDLRQLVLLALGRLLPLGPDHQAELPGEHGTADGREDLGRPLVDRPTGEVAGLVVDAHQCVAPGDAGAGTQRVPPLPERPRIERVHTAERVPLHFRLDLALQAGHLVFADERVAADEVRGGDGAAPTGGGSVGRITPERIVIPVGLGHVAEGVLVGAEVVGRIRVGARDPDALA